jgi:hypothetical protein
MKRALGNILVAVMSLFLFNSAVHAYNLPDTGQTTCYDPLGLPMFCSGTGQDGAYGLHTMSYTDNSDGTITDNVTGLMWQKCSSGQNALTCSGSAWSWSWYEAVGDSNPATNPTAADICGNLSLGTHTDWRLPTKKELISLMDYSVSDGATINAVYFPYASGDNYWASDEFSASSGSAWYGAFSWAGAGYAAKTTYAGVRCVRGVKTAQGLIDNGDHTVTDVKTCLMWQQDEQAKVNWNTALAICEGANTAGYSDWRLPDAKELESLVDETRHDPSINTSFFSGTYSDYYWTSTTGISDGTTAWYVYFGYGYTTSGGGVKTDTKYVRCVRDGLITDYFTRVTNAAGDAVYGYYDSIQAGYNAGEPDKPVRAKAMVFYEDLKFDRPFALTVVGGYGCGFSSAPSFTVVKGKLTISSGTVTVSNLVIR